MESSQATELPQIHYCDRPFCIECGTYFSVDGDIMVTLKCACVRERVMSAGQWRFLEEVGHGIGMTAVIFGYVKFDGAGTMFQQVDQWVLDRFGMHWSECDKASAIEELRRMRNG